MLSALKSVLLPPVMVAAGLLFVYMGFRSGQDAQALADHGKVAVATVDQIQWKEKRISGREKSFKLDIHFETEDKQPVHTKVSVSKELGRTFRDTDAATLTVRYLPEHPQTIALEGEGSAEKGFYLIGGLLAAVGSSLLAWRLFRRSARTV